jgi:hypothetical protein
MTPEIDDLSSMSERDLQMMGLSPEEIKAQKGNSLSGNNISSESAVNTAEAKTIDQKKNITETAAEQSLAPGDEIFSGGNFYKILDISRGTPEEIEREWELAGPQRDREFEKQVALLPYKAGSDNSFQERKKFDQGERSKLEKRLGRRQIIALLKGSDAETIQLGEENVIKVGSPEEREKIVAMQKEQDAAEAHVAGLMGLGNTKKMVDKISGQPGKF